MGRAYTAVMPSEGNTWAYNNQTGERIEIPKAAPVATTPSDQITVPSDTGFDRGYFTRQFNNQDLNATLAPGYDFRLKQGQTANLQANNLTGGAVGGNALKALQDYSQNFASGEYANAFNQFQTQRSNIYTNLQNIAKMGLEASTGQANAVIGTGTNIASSMQAQGNAQAASTMAQGQIYGNMVQSVAGAAGSGFGNYFGAQAAPSAGSTASNLSSLNWQAPQMGSQGSSGFGIRT